ncbi:MAG: hypothetical protein AAF329_14975 [Cyanobacteria bacterium P01_A01_bin.17]
MLPWSSYRMPVAQLVVLQLNLGASHCWSSKMVSGARVNNAQKMAVVTEK